ncbi:MAG: class D beta-lactamase [Deltaproteobacteria bacterium]|nr:class D beta-lactamase [Nannocystaceae bacterium]
MTKHRSTLFAAVVLAACPRNAQPETQQPADDVAPSAPAAAPMPALAESPAPVIEHPGCFMLARVDGSEAITVHPEDCARATPPASTFKVPHALIALQTGVIADPSKRVRWDGTKYDRKEWETDHDLRSAIRESVVWYFQRTAKTIGRDRMQHWITELHYGNEDVSGNLVEFWLEKGSLAVTGPQQLAFWQRLVKGELPIDRKHVDTVLAIVEAPLEFWKPRLPAGESPPPSTAVLHAKTGSLWDDHGNTTWWAGTVDGPNGQWVFVSRVISDQPWPDYSNAVHEGMKALAQAQVL